MARILDTVLKRSAEGADALLASALRSTREPERAGYLAAAELTVWSSLFRWKVLKAATKPTLMPLLAGRVLRSPANSRTKTVGLLGLAGGCFGDVVLLRPHRLTSGAAGFALNHLCYIRLLWQRGARPSLPGVAVRAIPLAAGIGLSIWKKPQLLPMVVGYGSLLSAVSVLADAPTLARRDDVASLGLGHGGNLFLISDALLISRELLLAGDSWASRFLDAGVMGTYTIAQLLLVDGLFSEDPEAT